MKILFFGDIFGRSGRDALIKKLSYFKEKYAPDFILVNGENASHGKGISHSICNDLFSAGIDVVTGGNHIFDNNDIFNFIDDEKRLLRPNNYPIDTPGNGYGIYEKNQKKAKVRTIHELKCLKVIKLFPRWKKRKSLLRMSFFLTKL